VEQERRDWGMSEEVRLFHKLVAHTGFIPASASAQCVEARQKSDLVQDDEDTYFAPSISLALSDPDDPLVTPTPSAAERQDPSADAQFASARKMARRTVYDLRYLRPDRMFGPFMPQPADENMGRQEGSSRRSRSDDDDDLAIAGLGIPEGIHPSVSSVTQPPAQGGSSASANEPSLDRRPFLSAQTAIGPRVPDFRGMTLRSVLEESAATRMPVQVLGEGMARDQDPPPGAVLTPGARVRVQFSR